MKPLVNKVKSNDSLLKIGMWNIEGLTSEKSNDPHFQDIVSKLSIVSFVETWIGNESIQEIVVPNFE